MKKNEYIEVKNSSNQLSLYGYNFYFDLFIKLFIEIKVPNIILLNGPKGIGKSTFVYHFINYILSLNEDKKYNIIKHEINHKNRSYNLICKKIHPNFFSLTADTGKKDIKISEVRDLLKFLHKSSYLLNKKYILIDSVDNLNIFSSNALLKTLEEPPKNVFFFIINDSKKKILPTIKSRAHEFKVNFSTKDKKNIFAQIIKDYNINLDPSDTMQNFYFDTPGNLLKYSLLLSTSNVNFNKNIYDSIFYFIAIYKKEKNVEILDFILLFIEIFYNKLCLNNNKNLNRYFYNKSKISYLFNELKEFNLSESNIFLNIEDILKNEIR
jgi:DNA polymerase-3 subunit delta'